MHGKITKITGPVSYHVLLNDGRQRCCHQDQLCLRVFESNPLSESDEEATSMNLSIPFSSSEEAPTLPEVAELDPHSPEEMSDSSKAQGTGVILAIIHKGAEQCQKDIKPDGLETLDHMLF